MATSWDASQVQCPFYHENTATEIKCEGAIPGSLVKQSFRTKGLRERVMEKYCKGCWRACPLYRIIEQKYGELYD